MKFIIIILLIILLVILIMNNANENNVENFGIPYIDPYSLCLHADTTRREEVWNLAHSQKLYYYDGVEPQHLKE